MLRPSKGEILISIIRKWQCYKYLGSLWLLNKNKIFYESFTFASNYFCEKSFLIEDQDKYEEIINAMDENENFIISNLNCLSKFDEDQSAGNSVTGLVPKLKDLHLSRKSKPGDRQLAGYVRAKIPANGTVVVGLANNDKILDVGTAIFTLTDEEAPREIGIISDIFGNVHEPMYSLQLRERAFDDTLKIDAEVFYLRDHPSTGYISVKRESNNRYTIVRNTESY